MTKKIVTHDEADEITLEGSPMGLDMLAILEELSPYPIRLSYPWFKCSKCRAHIHISDGIEIYAAKCCKTAIRKVKQIIFTESRGDL